MPSLNIQSAVIHPGPLAPVDPDQNEVGEFLTDQDWIDAARTLLVREGPGAVKIDRIAKACGVSRGGFYWRFKNREMLLQRLVDDWRAGNQKVLAEFDGFQGDPAAKIVFLTSLWSKYSAQSQYDLAMQGWGRSFPPAANAVARVVDDYLSRISKAFREIGFPEHDATFRAGVLYNHYLGSCSSISVGAKTPDTTRDFAVFLTGG